MVIFFESRRMLVDQKSSSGLPMTGEDAGLEALASPMAGYLGKVQERATSLEHCPWCTSKGLTFALRSYRIGLQDSLTLCTNPPCLFPLVSQPVEDILAKLKPPVNPTAGNKRKNLLPVGNEEPIKHLRSSEFDDTGTQSIIDTPPSQADLDAVNTVSNGQHGAPKTDGEKANGYHCDFDCPGQESLKDQDAVLEKASSEALLTTHGVEPALSTHCGASGVSEAEDDFKQVKSHPEVPNRRCSLAPNQSGPTNEGIYSTETDAPLPQLSEQTARTGQKPLPAGVTTCKDTEGIKSETEDLLSTSSAQSETLVSVPNQLFWKNNDNLCWLDSLLVALVNCKSLRKCRPRDEPLRSSVWQLMRQYEDICASVRVHQLTDRDDGVLVVPNHVLQKANADLQTLRMSVFKLLQPKLQCKLGQKETPVFAAPLLLTMDSWAEPLFQSTFRWEFKCSECRAASEERFAKTLPTFTDIVPDWRPLHAVHFAPCNRGCKRKQTRSMMLESVPPVFALHFVDGLPDNDIGIYTFSFEGKRYSVTTVIQYDHQLKHFVTWVSNSAGSWLEYDDLKHPHCETHEKLPVPAREMHLVFWEADEDRGPRVCSPSSTFPDPPTAKNEMNSGQSDKEGAVELLPCSPDQSLLVSHNDTDILCALSASEDHSFMGTNVAAAVDTSIGSTTLLDTFEGLSHDDIITLTLVELKPDSEMQPVSGDEHTGAASIPSKTEILNATPDSSSAAAVTDLCRSPDAELPTTASLSESESGNGSSTDLTFVPAARTRQARGQGRGRGRGKAAGGQKGRKGGASKAAPPISPPTSSEPSTGMSNQPASPAPQESSPPVEATKQSCPPSPADPSPLSTSQKSSTVLPPFDQHARWSFLLSKHPLSHVYKPTEEFTPVYTPASVSQAKSTPPAHSTPNPVKRPQAQAHGGLFPKPQLRTEESEGLPPKAAEMYGAFGAKSFNAPSPLPSPVPLKGSLTGALHPMYKDRGLPQVSSTKKPSSHSKTPPDTEVLRLKLLKKLKAKKKKLAKLNALLGHQGETGLGPDSTALTSPHTVTSSTYDCSTGSDFLSELLSPATTASNRSPDSTDFLEMLASGQDGVTHADGGVNALGGALHTVQASTDNFLDEFLLQAEATGPTEMESEALSGLEFF